MESTIKGHPKGRQVDSSCILHRKQARSSMLAIDQLRTNSDSISLDSQALFSKYWSTYTGCSDVARPSRGQGNQA